MPLRGRHEIRSARSAASPWGGADRGYAVFPAPPPRPFVAASRDGPRMCARRPDRGCRCVCADPALRHPECHSLNPLPEQRSTDGETRRWRMARRVSMATASRLASVIGPAASGTRGRRNTLYKKGVMSRATATLREHRKYYCRRAARTPPTNDLTDPAGSSYQAPPQANIRPIHPSR